MKKILVVDDEPNNLHLIRQILRDNYKLIFSTNGLDAIRCASKHLPDMILLDLMMPEMNGYEVCQKLKSSRTTKDIPVIFVSAMNEIEDEAQGFEVGAVDYIIKPVSPIVLKARIKTHLSLVRIDELESVQKASIQMLGEAGHYNDTDTGVHIWRMASYARIIAKGANWSTEQCELLELAAPMHDTGKIGIEDAILKKPGKLDKQEWETMKTHSEIGYSILSKSNTPLFQLAAEIARYHHEKWDGSGYPFQLKGSYIPESARIVAIADVFDALTMKRPYKQAWPIEQSVDEITKGAGSHFDPELVDVFLNALPDILDAKRIWDQKEQELFAFKKSA